jgi:pimeloyl-ACP methyl ester carboxylesterase
MFLGGHSYGGRQASMLAAAEPGLVDGLLLLSYPLHPPQRPAELRTGHFPNLKTPALFVHGTRDGFGSIDELGAALKLIQAQTELVPIAGAGHELMTKRNRDELPQILVEAFRLFTQDGVAWSDLPDTCKDQSASMLPANVTKYPPRWSWKYMDPFTLQYVAGHDTI